MRTHKAKHIRIQSHAIILACICLIVLAGIHCGGGEDRAYSSSSTLTILYPGEERILGPYWEMPAKFLVFLPLVSRNERGELEGRLAKQWEHSPDYRKWMITLRTDVHWHDGVPFTAHDVKFTWDLWSHPEVLWVPPGTATVTVVNDSTYTVTYQKRAESPLNTWPVYYPKHLLEDLDPKEFYDWNFWTHPVGNGPYRYVRHVAKTMMEFEANPDYFRGKPVIERVVLKFGESSLVELLSGNVGALGWAKPMDVLKLAENDRFRIYYHVNAKAARAILWKVTHPFFRDTRVRRALTHAIDRRELHRVLNFPEDLPIFDVIYTDRQFRRGALPEPLEYDSKMARHLLSQAGWDDADGDGVVERGGKEFRFVAIVPGEDQKTAIYVQDQLRRVGVRMEVEIMDLNLVRGRWKTGNFEAIFAIVDEGRQLRLFGKGSPLGYENARAAELLDAVQDVVDPDERDAIYIELMPIFLVEQPATFLYPLVTQYVVHRRVQGLSSPFRADPVMNMEYLWLKDED